VKISEQVAVRVSDVTGSEAERAVRGYLQAALDCVIMADASGRIVEFNPAAEQTFGYSREEAVGRPLAELIVPPSLRAQHEAAFARFVDTRQPHLIGRRLELVGMRADGAEFPVELALSVVEADPLLVCGALRDLSEATRTQTDLRRLADEQAALRRVATLVARGAEAGELFTTVAAEVAGVLDVPLIGMARFERDGSSTLIGAWGHDDALFVPGLRLPPHPGVWAEVRRTGKPARMFSYASSEDPISQALAAGGARSGVGVPILVNGELWGVISALSTDERPLPADIDTRLAGVTELLAMSIANTQAREDLQQLVSEQAALRRVATLVAEGTPPDDVFAAVAKEAALVLQVPAISLIRIEDGRTATKIGGWGATPFPVGTHWTLDEPSVMAEVARTYRPARIDDYEDVAGAHAAALREYGIHSAIGVPIVVHRQPWGVLVALSTDPEPLSADADERLARFTELIATAISNTQGRSDLELLAREQASLRRVATAIARQPTTSEALATVAEEVASTVDVPLTAVVRFDPDGTATQVGAWGEENPFPVGTSWVLDERSVSGMVARSGRPARVDDYGEVPGQIASRLANEAGIRTAVGVPVIVDGRAWGVVMALSTASWPIPDDTEMRLAGFTELVATAIANTQTREDLDVFVREQEALRRVATLAASGATPPEVFHAVADEVRQLLSLPLIVMTRYHSDDSVVVIAASGGAHPFDPGSRWLLDGSTISRLIFERGEPVRVDDYCDLTGTTAEVIQRAGIRAVVGVPIVVDNRVWGAVLTASGSEPLPPSTERRLAGFTELVATAISNTEARDALRAMAVEQMALRRVATIVAEGAGSPAVYDAICEETGTVVGATSVNLARFTADGFNLTLAGWSARDTHVPTGTRLPIEGGTINELVHTTGSPGRVADYSTKSGALASVIRERGIRSEVGAPVIVDGRVWGGLFAGWDSDEPPPDDVEKRLAGFAELVATAVANAATRAELIASRARIVTAGDEAKRRIERNLHDGTQQRLVALGLDVQAVRGMISAQETETLAELDEISRELEAVLEDVRELSRGLHPALLSQAGLPPSLRGLARRSPIPVRLEVSLDERPAEAIEIAAYYVVAEALANVAKHAEATEVTVSVAGFGQRLKVEICDDGVGGAEASGGSGLIGLIDRVEAHGGRFALESPIGKGTRMAVELPYNPPVPDEIEPRPSTLDIAASDQRVPAGLDDLIDPEDLAAALVSIADALYLVDARGRIRYLNSEALRILGYLDYGQLVGRQSHDTIHYLRPDGTPFPANECPLLRPRVSGELVRVEEDWFVRQDGSFVSVAYASAPIELSDGRGAVVAFREIESRR
jgi:PAS domain S-box-containing protein